MSFCPKCGNKIPEGANELFCGECGFRFEEGAAQEATEKNENPINTEEMIEKGKQFVGNVTETVKNVDVNEILTKAKNGDKKVIGIAVGAVAVVLILIMLITSVLGGGYMTPINDYMKAINKKNTDYFAVEGTLKGSKLTNASKKIRKELIAADAEIYGDSIEDYYKDYDESMEDLYDTISDEYDKFKLSFEKKKAEKMDKDDLEELAERLNDNYEDTLDNYEDMLDDDDELEEFADQYDIDEKDAKKVIKAYISNCKQFVDCKVTAGYEVKGKFIVKVDGKDEYETDNVKLFVVKLNGNWVYAGYEDSLSFDTDGDDEAYVLQGLLDKLKYTGLY